MDADRWRRAESLFHRALALAPPERDALLGAECNGDAELRALVERLLRADAAASPVLDAPGLALGSPAGEPCGGEGAASDALVGRRVGAFRLTARIGAGGMGVVYRAERTDGLFEQEVAVKLIRAGVASDDTLRRFQRERRTLASLVHPNIARLYDGGTTEDGAPYLVMELIDGQPIDRYCDELELSIEARLRLFATVCRAVHHAHASLVIHRDLKPANVLVDAQGTPKLLDFGIARLLSTPDDADAELDLTRNSARVLTPEYASPEQLAGGPLTTAADVYSLGVVLYGLLTGRRPFRIESTSPAAWERAVTERPPTRPSTAVLRQEPGAELLGGRTPDPREFAARCGTTPARLRHRLAGDLDRIVLMTLRKEPERRYASAQELAADVERHLAGLPILAREDSFAYRASKFVRRNRLAVSAACVVAAALVFGIVVTKRGELAAQRAAEHARIEADSFRAISEFLMTELQTARPIGETAELAESMVRIADQAEAVRRIHAADRHRQANLLDALGRVCMRLAAFEPARALLAEAYDLRVAEFGERNLEVALSLGSLGELDYRRGEYPAAVQKLERALELHRELPHGPHTEVDVAANDLAAALRAAGDLGRAEELHTEVLARRRRGGARTLPVAESLNNLAGIHLARGDYPAAIALLEEALAIRESVLGEHDPLTLQSRSNLANPLWHAGERERAVRLFEEAEAGFRALRSGGEEGLAAALSALATLDLVAGKHDAARRRLDEALAIRARRLGPDHPEVAALLAKQAELCQALGDLDAARAHWAEALRIRRAALPAKHPLIGRTLRAQGTFHYETGALDEALPAFEEALAILSEAPQHDQAELARAELSLGVCLRALDLADEARAHLRRAVELFDAAPGATEKERERARAEFAAVN